MTQSLLSFWREFTNVSKLIFSPSHDFDSHLLISPSFALFEVVVLWYMYYSPPFPFLSEEYFPAALFFSHFNPGLPKTPPGSMGDTIQTCMLLGRQGIITVAGEALVWMVCVWEGGGEARQT